MLYVTHFHWYHSLIVQDSVCLIYDLILMVFFMMKKSETPFSVFYKLIFPHYSHFLHSMNSYIHLLLFF